MHGETIKFVDTTKILVRKLEDNKFRRWKPTRWKKT